MKNNKLLACPYIVWMILFTIIPLGIVFYYALTDSITGQFTLANLAGMGTYLDGAANAAYLAVQMLALSAAGLAPQLDHFKQKMTDEVMAKNENLQKEVEAL